MQLKTIKKVISTKCNEWIDSITDEVLRKELRKNILVSGGSITSMLLNKPVNDFDIYINDKSVLKRLVKYYTNGFNITILDGVDRESLLLQLSENYFFCDGSIEDADMINNSYAIAVRNLHPEQIKLFLAHRSGGIRVNEEAKEELKYIPKFFSPNAISLSDQIQIVCRFHGDNVAIHKTFDFIHATNYFTYEDGLVTNKEALESIITKQLMYQGSMYPLTSIIRMKKFIKRNWNINAGEILKIMFQISQLDLTNPDVLEEQLIGVDVAFFSTLIEIIRGLPPTFKMTSGYINTLIDKVFNEDTNEII